MTDLDLGLLAFLQIAAILLTCRAVGWIGRRFFGQAQVVCEMVAGLMLGPSLFGLLAPTAQAWLFPKTIIIHGVVTRHPSMQILYVMSQIGLILYMFVTGIEFDFRLLSRQKGAAALVSLSGLIVPFLLGAAIAFAVFGDTRFFPVGIEKSSAMVFFGAALSITAFPALARIIQEKKLGDTPVGNLSLGAGAVGDAVAWILLAIVLAMTKHDATLALVAIGGGIVYTSFMLTAGRWVLARISAHVERSDQLSENAFAATLAILMLASWFTDAIGIYAVFGAFIVGAAMPKTRYAQWVRERIERLTISLLVPLFFVFSGLNTQVGLLSTPALWLLTGLIILAATVGKGLACTLAARFSGQTWRDSAAIGALMNTRGLMELIMLNIGRERGLISDQLFTMLVLMAIVTTLLTSPVFDWVYADRS